MVAKGKKAVGRRKFAYQRNSPWKSNMNRSAFYTKGRRLRKAGRLQKKDFRVPKFLMAQINPFERQCFHVRVPDESTAPSSSFYTYDEVNVALGAGSFTGNALAQYYYPNPRYVYTKSVVAAGSQPANWAWDSLYGSKFETSRYSSISQQYSLTRPVAHGIRITCGLAPTDTTGFCHIALYSLSDYNVSTWNLPLNFSDMTELPYYKRVTLASLTQNPLIVVNKFLDQTAFRYTDVSSGEQGNIGNPGSFHVANSWMGIMVVVEGHKQAPGVSIISVESICHFEGQSKYGGITQDIPAETPNPTFMAAASETVANTDSTFTDDSDSMKNRLSGALNKFATAAGETAVNYAVGAGVAALQMGAKRMRSNSYGISGVNSSTGRLAIQK